MKRCLFFLVLILLVWGYPVSAEESILTISSSITSVITYSDRALITRTGMLDFRPGTYQVVFEKLPEGVLEESVRVSGKGTAEVKVTGVEIKKAFLSKSEDVKVQKLEKEIRSLEVEDRKLQDDIEAEKVQQKFLESIRVFSTETASKELSLGRIDPLSWQKAMDFISKGMGETTSQVRSLEQKREELKAKLDALRKELQELKSLRQTEKRSVVVGLEATKGGTCELNITYIIVGARWNPLYDVRVSTETKKVQFNYNGQVIQRTGEDWQDVEIALSTSKPALGANAPELSPWYLQIPRPYYAAKKAEAMDRLGKVARMAVPAALAESEEKAEMELVPEEASLEVTGTSVLFNIKKKAEIPSDGAPHKVTIDVESFDANLEYTTVPKISPYAYLKAVVTNNTEYPFLAGPVDVFLGPDYVGRSRIESIAPAQQFTLSLGIDEGIKVKRDLVKKEVSSQGLFSKTEKVYYAYKITLESYKKNDSKITIIDQVPVSQNEEIKVKDVKLSPEPLERSDQGILKWEFGIKPKEKKEILMEFAVEYPKGMSIEGLIW